MLSKHSLCHQDVRLPNICFDEEYCIVLLDFDNTKFFDDLAEELEIFAKDLIKHAQDNKNAKIGSKQTLSYYTCAKVNGINTSFEGHLSILNVQHRLKK